jgi:hypothetical protein
VSLLQSFPEDARLSPALRHTYCGSAYANGRLDEAAADLSTVIGYRAFAPAIIGALRDTTANYQLPFALKRVKQKNIRNEQIFSALPPITDILGGRLARLGLGRRECFHSIQYSANPLGERPARA